MNKFKEIRPIVLGMVKKDNKILVSKGYDKVKDEYFYRSIGGGIEFLEESTTALKREFKEELNVDIIVGDFLGITENIFTYDGKDAHEIIFFYDVTIEDKDYKGSYHIVDDNCETDAEWVDVEKFKSGEYKIYPETVFKYM